MSMIARQTYGPSPEDPRRAVLRPGRDLSKSGRVSGSLEKMAEGEGQGG